MSCNSKICNAENRKQKRKKVIHVFVEKKNDCLKMTPCLIKLRFGKRLKLFSLSPVGKNELLTPNLTFKVPHFQVQLVTRHSRQEEPHPPAHLTAYL